MSLRKDFEREVGRYVNVLLEKPSHTGEEINLIGRTMPVKVMKDPKLFISFALDKNLSLADCATILGWIYSMQEFLTDVRVNNDITYEDVHKCYEQVRTSTIIIHRVNYILHDCMLKVYDILERDKRDRFSIKKAINDAEKPWDAYLSDRRRRIERTAWYAFQDHLRLSSDAVSPYLEKVYESIRDNMISLGYRDVEVKAWCVITLLMGKVEGHTYRAFFKDFEEDYGVDYSRCFTEDDLQVMVGRFSNLCKALNIATEKDSFGFWIAKDYNPEKSGRFSSAWNALINAMRDDELMDETARNAIELNPEVKKEYSHILEQEEKKMMEESVGKLSDKYKISRL